VIDLYLRFAIVYSSQTQFASLCLSALWFVSLDFWLPNCEESSCNERYRRLRRMRVA